MSEIYQLNEWTERYHRGEREAAGRLREAIAPRMVYLVREALRSPDGTKPFDRRVLAEARRALGTDPDQPPEYSEPLVRQVAQRLCDSLCQQSPQATTATLCLAEATVA